MTVTAFLGLGEMGSALARTAITAGHHAVVWNRNPARATHFSHIAATPADAVAGADVMVACLFDAASVHDVLDPFADGMPGKALINLTTISPDVARELATWAEGHGIAYLDGGIMAVPSMIGTPAATVLYSGSRNVFDENLALLETWGSAEYFGDDAGMAALYDLALLAGMYVMFAGFFHGAAMVGAAGVSAAEFAGRATPWLQAMAESLGEYAAVIDSGDYGAAGQQSLQFSDLTDILDATRSLHVRTDVVDAVQRFIHQQIDAGHGTDGFARMIEHPQVSVTVIGLGPMGQALTTALLEAGHDVTVWNRTKERASAVTQRGAAWAATPADAVRASALTLINVMDNAVVDHIVGQAGTAVAGRLIVGLASDTPTGAQRTAGTVTALGGRYLDGAIMTPVDTVGSPEASILFAGARGLYDAHRAVFDALGTTTWLGESPLLAAGYDMALLDLFWTATAGFLHAVESARHAGIGPREFLPHALGILGILPAIFTDAAERIEDNRHDEATSSLTSIANSIRHLISASEDAGLDASALSAFCRHVDRAIDQGHGDHEATAVTHRS